jgi:FAD dependent oxidoreductase TIGR03364
MAGQESYDDAVVGAGILGLSHAYELARRGRRVIVFERSSQACGASIRNFGMLWPIGQPFGARRDLAKRSLRIWLEVLQASGLWHERTGSLHLAYHLDEAEVLREYAQQCLIHGEHVAHLSRAEVRGRAPAVRQESLQLGLWSEEEVCVDPRQVVTRLPAWLSREFGVAFQFEATITAIDPPMIVTGRTKWSADRFWICCGDELGLLFAEELKGTGLVRCKLQMMRSQPYGNEWRLGPMLAAGLTLLHYAAFRDCPSLAAVRQRIARESPWFERYGIHVLISQNDRGELTIGDSHEYEESIEPFDRAEIEDWIVGYLKTFVHPPGLRIVSRWHGTYSKHPDKPYVILNPVPRAVVITGLGGAGMTLSFGLADEVVSHELGE